MPHPEILDLCQRLRSNDPNLTTLKAALTLFDDPVAEIHLILQALLENEVVTELEVFLPDSDQDECQEQEERSTSSRASRLLEQILGRRNCPIRALRLTSVGLLSWESVCTAVRSSKSVKELGMGMAWAMFDGESADTLGRKECAQLGEALAASSVDHFALRHFHIHDDGMALLAQGLVHTKQVELQQITCDSKSVLWHLFGLCRSLESLSLIQCKSTTNIPFSAPWSPPPTSPARDLQKASLRTLQIAECCGQEICQALLDVETMDSLVVLELIDCDLRQLFSPSLVRWLVALSALEKINLEGCKLSDEHFTDLAAEFSDHESIREISLQRNNLDGKAPNLIQLPPKLESLDLSLNRGIGDSTLLPQVVANNRHVQKWCLGSTDMSVVGLANLSEALFSEGKPPRITLLCLDNNEVGFRGVRILSRLIKSSLASLEEIKLANCDLDDHCIDVLSGSLKGHQSLRKIGIAFNAVSNTSCRTLADLCVKVPCLECLDISFGKFDRDGLLPFVEALKKNFLLCQLTYWNYSAFTRKPTHVGDLLSFWLRLNKSGRRVAADDSIPLNLFPTILERAGRIGEEPATYCILRDNIDRILPS